MNKLLFSSAPSRHQLHQRQQLQHWGDRPLQPAHAGKQQDTSVRSRKSPQGGSHGEIILKKEWGVLFQLCVMGVMANRASTYVLKSKQASEATSRIKLNIRILLAQIHHWIFSIIQATVRIFLRPTEDNQDAPLSEYLFFMAANSSNPEDGNDNQVHWSSKQCQYSIQIGSRIL